MSHGQDTPENVWQSALGIVVADILITNQPRSIEITLRSDSSASKLVLRNPANLSSVVKLLDDCRQLRILDNNVVTNSELAAGRYELEIRDENLTIGTIQCDAYSIE